MKIILVSSKHGRSTTVAAWLLAPLVVVVLSAITGAGYLGYEHLRPTQSDIVDPNTSLVWLDRIELQAAQVEKTRVYTEEQINALRIRLAQLQARLTRLDALGERLVDVASLDKGEFDFSVPPAVGGPESICRLPSP